MAWDKLGIANLTLNILNKKSVNSLDDSGEFSDALNRGINLLYPSELAKNSWRFCVRVQQLSVLVDDPPLDEWKYQMQLPADYLALVRLHPHVDFQIYGKRIYANNNDLKLEYRYLLDYDQLPDYFVHYFALKLANWYASAVANDASLAEEIMKMMREARAEALFADGQSHPSRPIQSSPMISVRGSGYPRDVDWPPSTS